MARSPIALAVGISCAAMLGVVISQKASNSRLQSRTRVFAADKGMPVPWMKSAGKPRTPKPAYNKQVISSPMLKPQPWVGEWVDPVKMFSGKLDFGRKGNAKSSVSYSSNKVASPVQKVQKKPWTGNLASYYEKLVAKGQPYVAPSMEKAAPTSSVKYPGSWIGSASDALIKGCAESIMYMDNPQPKKKMWITSGDPNGPWKLKKAEKAIPAKAETTTTVAEAVVSSEAAAPAAVEEKKVAVGVSA